MPKYGYKCQQCNTEFDIDAKIGTAPATKECSCGGEGKRVFTAPGLLFKGNGWVCNTGCRVPLPKGS